MAQGAGGSLPQQMHSWSDLKAAYRFLNNDRVTPEKIGGPHRAWTRRQCQGHKIILCVQDDTDIHGAKVAGGRGDDRNEVLHTTLAVTLSGEVLGVLDQRWFTHVQPQAGETQSQRAARWRETDVWQDAVTAVGPVPEDSRYIHVADRASDNLRFLHACGEAGHGFVIRAQHDRRVEQATDRLWPYLGQMPCHGTLQVTIGAQRVNGSGKGQRVGRVATLSVRYATVQLERPKNHPGAVKPLTVQAVYLIEEHPPKSVEPVDWMLLTSEPVDNLQAAFFIAGCYQKRWVIEEWHRVLKEGCKLEHSQVETRHALCCLSAMLSIVAVRLLQLRDMAQSAASSKVTALRRSVPLVWITVVAILAQQNPARLSPRAFWLTIAKQGGYLARTADGQPGWKVIWRGWYDISHMVRYAELLERKTKRHTKCG